MSQQKINQLIIIGSGPAGLTAGVYSARANLNPLIIQGNTPGGQLMGTSYVENWPGEKKIMGPELMDKIKEHAILFGCQFLDSTVISVDFSKKPFSVFTKREEFKTNSVIIATGSTYKKLNCPGEKEYTAKGVTNCAVCDGAFYKNQPVIIIGGGDTAMEDASFMTNFTDNITIIHLLDKLTASHAMQQRVLNNPKIKIIYNSTVTEFLGDNNHLTHAVITNQKDNTRTKIETKAAFVAIGLNPNTVPFINQLELDKFGYIVTKDSVKTSVPGVFAAGDVCDPRYKQAVFSAGIGCIAALEAERYLSGLNLK